ncbi:hypothetical protein EVG20_g354 [Dentipellis fragilis]|uniref:Uncharacterized protein n=1 Tax=Dentipellis fragilis TaxID=205917 RepID=A0A4Y9ZFY5_9AGAM|nr:hypothetical protein EVG20_g354 [Dentipellis fragilis]
MIINEQKAEQANGDVETPAAPPPAYPSQYPTSPGPSYYPQSPQANPEPRNSGYPPHSGPWSPRNQPPYDPQTQWLGEQYRSQLLARCAQGDHDVSTSFGLCGILCAILLFPLGLICLCIDTEKKCSRCGVRLG